MRAYTFPYRAPTHGTGHQLLVIRYHEHTISKGNAPPDINLGMKAHSEFFSNATLISLCCSAEQTKMIILSRRNDL